MSVSLVIVIQEKEKRGSFQISLSEQGMKVWGLALGSFRGQWSWSRMEGTARRKDTGEAVKRSNACTGVTCVGLSFLTCSWGE